MGTLEKVRCKGPQEAHRSGASAALVCLGKLLLAGRLPAPRTGRQPHPVRLWLDTVGAPKLAPGAPLPCGGNGIPDVEPLGLPAVLRLPLSTQSLDESSRQRSYSTLPKLDEIRLCDYSA